MTRNYGVVMVVLVITLFTCAPQGAAQTAAGGGQTSEPVRFAFVATKLPNGAATGQAQFFLPAQNIRLHVQINCLCVFGNTAVMSGVVTNASDPTDIGRVALFAARDKGNGGSGVPDEFFGPVAIPPFLDCEIFGQPPPGFPFPPIVVGNIQVQP